jgi:hypothetical protein
MHVLVAIRWENGDVLVSADGGQVGLKKLQACKLVRRKWEQRADGYYLGGRKVVGWICVDLLGFREGLVTVPEVWETAA